MQIPNNNKDLNKALIIIIPIMITIAFLLILNNTEIQIYKQEGPRIKESYSAIKNITWDISENEDRSVLATLLEDGTLTIFGKGKMKSWNHSYKKNWYEMKEQIKSVIIGEGVTNIGGFAFEGCTNLTNIVIPNTVTNIGNSAFMKCTNLANTKVPNSVTNIEYGAFSECPSLKIYCTSDSYVKKYAIKNNIAYAIDDEAPTTSVIGNPTQWTNKNVTLTVSAIDSLSGLAEKPYSFDGGKTWQAENTKTYTKNTIGILIKVKDKAGNIATYSTTNKPPKLELY